MLYFFYRICLLSFSDRATVHIRPGDVTSKKDAINRMDIYHEGGGTNTYLALQETQRVFSRVNRVIK